MSRVPRIVLLVLPLLLLSGCDLFTSEEEDIVIEATGRVVLAETGEPIAGLNAAISEIPSPIGAVDVVASARTDAEGRFALHYRRSAPPGGSTLVDYMIEVNARPYDDRYTLLRRSASPGGVYDFGVIELEEAEAP